MFLNCYEFIKMFLTKKILLLPSGAADSTFLPGTWDYSRRLLINTDSVWQQRQKRKKIFQATKYCWRSCITKKFIISQVYNV